MRTGFPAGLAYDGTAAYLGTANVTCNGIHVGVSRLAIELLKSGAYYPCSKSGSEVAYKNATVQSLNYHPNMKWKNVTSLTLASALMCTYMSGLDTYGYGRYVSPIGHTIIGEV